MLINAKFPGACKCYNARRYDVYVGQAFLVELVGEQAGVEWFADNDPVLEMKVAPDGLSALITASHAGRSRIELQRRGKMIDAIRFDVLDREVATLGLKAERPERK